MGYKLAQLKALLRFLYSATIDRQLNNHGYILPGLGAKLMSDMPRIYDVLVPLGKYLKQFVQDSNVVVLQPEIQKAFPTSEAVNKALASMLAFAQETQGLAGRAGRTPRKRVAAKL